ncbi:ComF family protein [Acidobacteriota bacterium]
MKEATLTNPTPHFDQPDKTHFTIKNMGSNDMSRHIYPIRHAVVAALDFTASVIFPQPCCICEQWRRDCETGLVCRSCWSEVLPLSDPACTVCGLPLPRPSTSEAPVRPTCFRCQVRLPVYRSARAYGLFEGILKRVILLYKYAGHGYVGLKLADKMASSPVTNVILRNADIIIPIPLSKKRKRERGYDQASLIAARLAVRSHLALSLRTLIRCKHTAPQAGLSFRMRQDNVRGAFAIRRPNRVKDRIIVLVDDVLTTGATAEECARTLRNAGARDVRVLTAARTPLR